jgi:hypothetical protein
MVGALARPGAYWLPARFEPLQEIGRANDDNLSSPATFANYLKATHVDLLVLPKQNAPEEFFSRKVVSDSNSLQIARNAVSELSGSTSVRSSESEHFSFFALSESGNKCLLPSPPTDPCSTTATTQLPATNIESSPATGTNHPVIWLEPSALNACEKHARVTVHWDTTALAIVRTVEASVSSGADEKVFARGGPVGNKQTGPWMAPGTRMILRNYADGSLLGCATVASKPCENGR